MEAAIDREDANACMHANEETCGGEAGDGMEWRREVYRTETHGALARCVGIIEIRWVSGYVSCKTW